MVGSSVVRGLGCGRPQSWWAARLWSASVVVEARLWSAPPSWWWLGCGRPPSWWCRLWWPLGPAGGRLWSAPQSWWVARLWSAPPSWWVARLWSASVVVGGSVVVGSSVVVGGRLLLRAVARRSASVVVGPVVVGLCRGVCSVVVAPPSWWVARLWSAPPSWWALGCVGSSVVGGRLWSLLRRGGSLWWPSVVAGSVVVAPPSS